MYTAKYWELIDYRLDVWRIHRAFISHELYFFYGEEELRYHFTLIVFNEG